MPDLKEEIPFIADSVLPLVIFMLLSCLVSVISQPLCARHSLLSIQKWVLVHLLKRDGIEAFNNLSFLNVLNKS